MRKLLKNLLTWYLNADRTRIAKYLFLLFGILMCLGAISDNRMYASVNPAIVGSGMIITGGVLAIADALQKRGKDHPPL